MTEPRPRDPRWRQKPCTKCGTVDWMYGRRSLCAGCRTAKVTSPDGQQKIVAQLAARNAVRTGVIVREPCIACTAAGREQYGKSHGHHEDYSKPLEVIWLCAFHHKMVHSYGLAYLTQQYGIAA